jgi:hypothetical protein
VKFELRALNLNHTSLPLKSCSLQIIPFNSEL